MDLKNVGDEKKNARTEIVRIILLMIPTLFLGSATLIFPFGRDQGEYATIAMEVLSGKVAYVDVFNIKPPMTHVIHAWAIQFFGHSMASIRIMDLVWQCLTVAVIILIIKRYINYATAVVFSFAYPFFYFSTGYWYTAQTDGFLTLPIAASLLCFLDYKENNNKWSLIASGILIGIAFLFKYPIAILLVFLGFTLIKRRGLWKNILLLWIGFLLPLLIFAFDLLGHNGLSNFISTQYTYISNYSIDMGVMDPRVVLLLNLLILILTFLVSCRTKEVNYILISWWMSAMVHMISQNKLYIYHFYPLLAPTLILFSNGIGSIYQKMFHDFRIYRSFGSIVLVISFLGFYIRSPYWTLHTRTFAMATGPRTLQDTYKIFEDVGDYSIGSDINVSNYIRERTTLDDTIFIWGFEPVIYFLAERNVASEYIYNFPFYYDLGSVDLETKLVHEIEINRPVYFIVVDNDSLPWVTGTNKDSIELFISLEVLHQFVFEHYTFETKIDDFYLYHLGDHTLSSK